MKRTPRPSNPGDAVARALAIATSEASTPVPHLYGLGAGNFVPARPDSPFTVYVDPKTERKSLRCDCMGLIAYAYRLPRRREGFNAGRWSTVEGYVNCDSAIQDAEHEQDLFELVDDPRPGDLVIWPSIYAGELASPYRGRTGVRRRIGHIAIITEVRTAIWRMKKDYSLLSVVQCGSKHSPAVHRSNAAVWANKDRTQWGRRDEWGSRIVRPIP